MSPTFAIAKRELYALWVTPLAWILLGLFTLLYGAALITILTTLLETTDNVIDLGPMQAFFGQSIFIPLGYLIFCPALSMRALAEERHRGTAETLLSTRATATHIVVGKYLALAITYIALWTPTLLYPTILRNAGLVEWSVVASSYFGVIGLGLGFLAIGLLASAATNNQLVSAALSSALVFLFLLAGTAEQLTQDTPLHIWFYHLSVQAFLAETAQGILSLKRVVYVVTLTALPLFLATIAVERWRNG